MISGERRGLGDVKRLVACPEPGMRTTAHKLRRGAHSLRAAIGVSLVALLVSAVFAYAFLRLIAAIVFSPAGR